MSPSCTKINNLRNKTKIWNYQEPEYKNAEFEDILKISVENALSSLGNSGKNATYYYLTKIFGVEKDNLPQKFDVFVKALEEMFGSGAQFIFKLIIEDLYARMELKPEKNVQIDILNAINYAKTVFREERQNERKKRRKSENCREKSRVY